MTARELLMELASVCSDGAADLPIGFGTDEFTEVGSIMRHDIPKRITLEAVSKSELVRLKIQRLREEADD